MGSGWLPREIFHAVDTARYVWSSSRRLANGSMPGLNGDDGDEASSLRMNPGMKSDDVTRCALYGQPFQRSKQVGECAIITREENTQEKVRVHRPPAVAPRGPTANTVPDDVSPYDLFEHALEPNFRFCIAARSCEPLSRPFLNEIVDGTACCFHHSSIPLAWVAWEFDDECRVLADTAVKRERRTLLRQKYMVVIRRREREGRREIRQRPGGCRCGKVRRWDESWLADMMNCGLR